MGLRRVSPIRRWRMERPSQHHLLLWSCDPSGRDEVWNFDLHTRGAVLSSAGAISATSLTSNATITLSFVSTDVKLASNLETGGTVSLPMLTKWIGKAPGGQGRRMCATYIEWTPGIG